MLNKFSLNFKLIAMFTTCAILLLIVGLVGVNALQSVNQLSGRVIKINFPNVVAVNLMRAHANDSLRMLLQMNLAGNDEKELAHLDGKIKDEIKNFDDLNTVYQAIEFVEGEKAVYDDFVEHWEVVEKYMNQAIPLAKSTDPNDKVAFAQLYRGDFQKARDSFYAKTKALVQFHDNEGKKWSKKAEETSAFETQLTFFIVAFGFLLSMIVGIIFSRSLSKQLVAVTQNLVTGATEVSSAATSISNSSETLSSSTSEQAAAVQETSSAVEELSSMVKKNSDNAERSRDKASTSQEVAQRGREVVSEMMTAITEINASNQEIMTAVEQSNKNIADISRVIMEIGAKTTVIKDIVFQTKILSFNASVEAARAGEHGKGFSIVAEEVGNLAQMSGNAAQEISFTLEESIKKVNQIVEDTKSQVEVLILKGKEKVDRGHVIATQCGEILEQIVAESTDVSSMVSEISTASKEQSIGIQEITKAMSQMDVVTQQNASVSQTSASASVQLAAQADSLSTLVKEMQSIIYGAAAGPQSAQAAAPVSSSRSFKSKKFKTKQAQVIQLNNRDSDLDVPNYDDIKAVGEA